MKVILYILAAVCGYFVSGMNPAIALSKAIYKKDIRLSNFKSASDAAFTPMLNAQLRCAPNGIHVKDICQQCKSRVIAIDVIDIFREVKSKPDVAVIIVFGVSLTLALKFIVWLIFLR